MSGIIGSTQTTGGMIDSSFPTCYARLKNCSTTYGDMTFGTLEGDSTNITQSGVNVILGKSGIYLLTCQFSWSIAGGSNRRYVFGKINSVSGSRGTDQIAFVADSCPPATDGDPDYGGATAVFVGPMVEGDAFKYSFSDSTGSGSIIYVAEATIARLYAAPPST